MVIGGSSGGIGAALGAARLGAQVHDAPLMKTDPFFTPWKPGSAHIEGRSFSVPSYGLRLCVQHYPPEAGDAHLLKTPPPGGYDAAQHSGFVQKNRFGPFKPDATVTEAELVGMIDLLERRPGAAANGAAAPGESGKPLTRGEACRVIGARLADRASR